MVNPAPTIAVQAAAVAVIKQQITRPSVGFSCFKRCVIMTPGGSIRGIYPNDSAIFADKAAV